MNITINPSLLSGEIKSIISKSDMHRCLICSALSTDQGQLILDDGPDFQDEHVMSQDIVATINCLEKSGATIVMDNNLINIKPINKELISDNLIYDCAESGSTLRFLLPVISTFGKEFTITGHGRLPKRPISELINQLIEHGCSINSVSSESSLPIEITGKLTSGTYKIPGNISSQYISGLLFALPLLEGDSTIEVTTIIESKSYIDMTVNTMKKFGVTVDFIDGANNNGVSKFLIKGNQQYKNIMKRYDVEGDWSNSAFWLCAGAFSEEGVTCKGLSLDSLQPDKAILKLLDMMGADVEIVGNNVKVCRNELRAIDVDASEFPDLVPVLAVVLSVCKGKSQIYNAGRLRFKESDRLSAMVENLKKIGAKIEETKDGLIIDGVRELNGGIVKGFNDHRIVMAMTIASLICTNDIIIDGSEAIRKSYISFFEDFKMLGGKINVI